MLLLATKIDPDFMAVREQLAWIEYQDDVEKGIERAKGILQEDPSRPDLLWLFARDSATRF